MQTRNSEKVHFEGRVLAVKARIRLIRSFDEVSHAYLGYTLVLDGSVEDLPSSELRVGIGPKTYQKHLFRVGDRVEGRAVPVPNPKQEWATHYKVSGLRLLSRGPVEEETQAHPEGGIAPPLAEYRKRGHLRLDPRTYKASCQQCPFGLVMATEIILDHWNPSKKRWRFETHCYGPRDCPRYRAGRARRVPGRKPWMIWVDDDVEREEEEQRWHLS